jgi:GH15 family glucan-1,4-alpha-glucosidase
LAHDIARVADFVSTHWREPDSGIWEVRAGLRHYTHSKAMCWIALDRASRLAEAGHIPTPPRGAWLRAAAEIQRFIDERCWSEARRSYLVHLALINAAIALAEPAPCACGARWPAALPGRWC